MNFDLDFIIKQKNLFIGSNILNSLLIYIYIIYIVIYIFSLFVDLLE